MITTCVALAACGNTERRADAAPPQAAAEAPRPAARRDVLFLGTSLTAGLGVETDSAFPAVIQRRLDSLRLPWRVRNAGNSGETSAGALRRMTWLLREPPAVLVIETGANDGLRGLDADSTRANIDSIISLARGADRAIVIVLVGMEAPPNMGAPFTRRFRALFPDLAARRQLRLVPFLLAGVGGVDSLNQPDGIHPTPAGHRVLADNVWRVLEPLLTPSPSATP